MIAPLRLGLIGCGGIAQSAHLPALHTLRDQATLVAAADILPGQAERATSGTGAASYTDYRALLDRPDIEAVLVATPEAMHAEQVTAAAAAGKHVLCEKPMAGSLAEATAMIEACRVAGVRLMVGHSRRFTSRYLEVRKLLDLDAIGPVRLVRENERRNRGFGASSAIAWTPQHWTGDPATNQGAAMLVGIHEMDLVRWFMDDEPVSVYAEHAVQKPGNVGVPDFISLTIRFAGGGIGSTEITWLPPAGYPAYHQLELYGARGAIRARDHDSLTLTHYTDAGAGFPGNHEMLIRNGPIYVRQLADFIAGLREERPFWVSPEDARAALALAMGAIRSARQRRPVTLREMLTDNEGRP